MNEIIAETAGWLGFAVLMIAIGIPVGAVATLPFSFVLEDAAAAARAKTGWMPPTLIGEALITAFCVTWLVFASIVVSAFGNAIFVLFEDADLRYYYAVFVMPLYLLGWLSIGVIALIKPVRPAWLLIAVAGALVMTKIYLSLFPSALIF